MSNCAVCGDKTNKPLRAALRHFKLVEWNQWQYWPGNIRTFGFWGGLSASITLSFPIICTILYWKHRRSRLVIGSGTGSQDSES